MGWAIDVLRWWCRGTLKDVFGFDIPIVCHAEEVSYLRWLLRIALKVDAASEYRGLDVCYFEDPIDGFHLDKDADYWGREPEFEERQ